MRGVPLASRDTGFFMIDINDIITQASLIAEERHQQKKGYKSHNALSPNYELVGVLGEMLFSKITNLPFNSSLLKEGDDGYDFLSFNIKTSEEYKAKHLIEYLDKQFNGTYVFMIVNLEKKYGYVKGWITSDEFKQIAEIIDFGYGKRLAIPLEKLKEGLPPMAQ